jgi:Ca2+-transporting ATPase
MIETIHDAVTGRARYRVSALYKSESLRKKIEGGLKHEAGIRHVSASALTGSVLVRFDAQRNSGDVARLIETFLSANGVAPPTLKSDSIFEERIPIPSTNGAEAPPRTVKETRKLLKSAQAQNGHAWYSVDAASVFEHYGSSERHGLSAQTAAAHLHKYGPNVLPETLPPSGWSIFFDQFKSLPVLLLGVAASVSVLTGGIADAVVIGGVVLINATIGFVTESHAEQTIQALKNVVRPSALVIRDGQVRQVRAENLVPGDLLALKAGVYVGADARLVDANNLRVDESALTGESLPMTKNTEIILSADVPLADRSNMVFMGTLVTGGTGVAIVVATGRFTEMGQIQFLVGDARPPATPMEKQLDKMGSQLVYVCGGICALVFGIGIMRGIPLMQMLQSSISLAVAAVPEGLPAVATTTLAIGIHNMRRRRVLIRRLEAVETLGAVQALCLDKTGTLTLNHMSVVAIYAGTNRFKLEDGRLFCNGIPVEAANYEELLRLMQVGVLCTESEVSPDGGNFTVKGSSTENALFQLATAAGIDLQSLFKHYPVVKVRERAENRNYMVTLHSSDIEGRFLAVKGNPEEVLAMCSRQMRGGVIVPITDEDIERIHAENELMAADALRVLGMAYCEVDGAVNEFEGDEGFIWLGMTGMADPVRKGVKELISTFHRAGIDTVMVTGDQSLTAHAIGKELGLSRDGEIEILDSTHLNNIPPEVMEALAQKINIFARVSPANKLQIVQSMQRGGKVVAMTGDGINDSPALKAADIGIAMGKNGTPVAREVADVILEDDNIETMAEAISHGRTIYGNIRKSIHYLLATNFSEIMVMGMALGVGMGQPLSTRQLLWINLVSDILPGLSLAMESPEPDVLNRPPRDPSDPIIKTADFKRITFESGAIATASLGAYGYGLARYGIGAQAGTIGFMSLTLAQLLHALSCRSERHSLFGKVSLLSNPYLNAALGFSLGVQVLTMAMPGLRAFLGLAPIGLLDAAVIGGAAVLPLAVNEATKGGLQ